MRGWKQILFYTIFCVCSVAAEIVPEDALAIAILQRKAQVEDFPSREAVRLEVAFYAARIATEKVQLLPHYEGLWSVDERGTEWYRREAELAESIASSLSLLKTVYSLLVDVECEHIPAGLAWRKFQQVRKQFEAVRAEQKG